MSNGRPHAPARRAPLQRTLAAGAAALLAACLTTGCIPGYYPGGSLATRDLFTYPSEPNWPQTIVLVDTRYEKSLWSVEIPIGQQLVVRFYEDQTDDPDFPAMMRWELMPLGKNFGELDNAMPVPSRLARRIDTFLRPYEPESAYPVPTPVPGVPAAAPDPPAPAAELPAAAPAAPEEPAEPAPAPAPELDLPPGVE